MEVGEAGSAGPEGSLGHAAELRRATPVLWTRPRPGAGRPPRDRLSEGSEAGGTRQRGEAQLRGAAFPTPRL